MTKKELSGIAHELAFWTKFVKSEQFKTWLAPSPTPELHHDVRQFIQTLSTSNLKTMDVGSGVSSVLHGLPGLDIMTFDPLGQLYECIFNYQAHRITPPIPIPAEEIDFKNSFDLVHMRNALDHAQDPVKSLFNLVDACVSGGHVIIQGFENEAQSENFQGFHQYNITLSDKWLVVNDHEIHVPNVEPVLVKKDTLSNGKTWIIWIAKKL